MQISAHLSTGNGIHQVTLSTGSRTQPLTVAAHPNGNGSAVNGGEFLMLALATCYTNDLYREAALLGIRINTIEVVASADFEGIGLGARNIKYRASIDSPAAPEAIAALLRQTDAVAEIHNTLRCANVVTLST
jgi:organic hydroperoxide reductase OsmC/OhrA